MTDKRICHRVVTLTAAIGMLCVLVALGFSQENDRSLERLKWFRHDKFGMFIHWGLYAIPGGEWEGKQIRGLGEWIMKRAEIPAKEYELLSRQFNPVKFNADEWVRLAKSAGMKYLVITAKHHDGFAMYHSKVSGYNIVDATPYKRDPMKDLAEACRKEGIKFCFYYSQAEDWHHPDAVGNNWDFPDENKKDFSRYVEGKSIPQVKELLTQYGPIELIWFDRGLKTRDQAVEMVALVHQLQPNCLVNGRVGDYRKVLEGDYQSLGDNQIPEGAVEEIWETPATINDTWGYKKNDTNWKSSADIIHKLVDIVSKGGNYLLNVGPTAEGIIPPASVRILQEVGKWMDKNGESIYGTTTSPFAKLPWGKCTAKPGRLYLHVFDWPLDSKLEVPDLRNKVKNAYLLIDKKRNKLPVLREDENTVVITLPDQAIDEVNTVVVLEIEGKPDVEPVIVEQGADYTVSLSFFDAITQGKATKRFNRRGSYHFADWTDPKDGVSWNFRIAGAGSFDIEIVYAAPSECQDNEYTLTVGEKKITAKVQDTEGWFEFKTINLGIVSLGPGKYLLSIKPKTTTKTSLMHLKSAMLVPKKK